MSIQYLRLHHLLAIHDTLIREIGGSFGMRDQGLVESALGQAQQSFGGQDLYPSIFDKASILAFAISENQAFVDGNKRTAATAAGVFLEINGYRLDCPKGQVYEVMMKLANKELKREDLALWLQEHSVPLKD